MTQQELEWISNDVSTIKAVAWGILALLVAIAFILSLIHDRMYRRDNNL